MFDRSRVTAHLPNYSPCQYNTFNNLMEASGVKISGGLSILVTPLESFRLNLVRAMNIPTAVTVPSTQMTVITHFHVPSQV